MKLLFSLILLGSLNSFAFAFQDTNRYKSAYQSKVFESLKDSASLDALEIMISLDYKEGNEQLIEDAFTAIYINLDPEKIQNKSLKKRIKTIFNQIHDTKLKKYIIDADFIQLFENGEYNCVSATALYAEILDRFKIEYEIRETPNHVYLIADPSGEKILIETTSPENGAIEYDYKTQKDYVNYLKANKLISEEEFDNTPIEKLFDEHFDQNKVINKTQLAALLYYNRGVKLYNAEDYADAAFYLKLAYAIYPSSGIHFLANYAFINALIKNEKENNFDPILLADFVRLHHKDSEFSSLGVEHFSYVGNELMIVHPNPEEYFDYYEKFKAELDTSHNLEQYELEFNNRIYYYHYMKRDYALALTALKVSFDINPDNLQTKEAIFNTTAMHCMADKEHAKNLDSIEMYIELFPFLAEDEKVIGYYNYSQMRAIRESFHFGNVDGGLEKLDKLEAKLKVNGINSGIDRNYLDEVYIDLANYYMRQERINSAVAALKRGLEMDPTSALLKDRYVQLYQLNVQYNEQQKFYKSIMVEEEDSYEEKFDKWFVACWKSDGKLTKDMEETSYDETFKIMSYKDNKLTYIMNGQSRKGTFSLRKKSKILYLIPNDDNDDYTIFKLENINDREMILMPFKNDKLTGERIYMSKC